MRVNRSRRSCTVNELSSTPRTLRCSHPQFAGDSLAPMARRPGPLLFFCLAGLVSGCASKGPRAFPTGGSPFEKRSLSNARDAGNTSIDSGPIGDVGAPDVPVPPGARSASGNHRITATEGARGRHRQKPERRSRSDRVRAALHCACGMWLVFIARRRAGAAGFGSTSTGPRAMMLR